MAGDPMPSLGAKGFEVPVLAEPRRFEIRPATPGGQRMSGDNSKLAMLAILQVGSPPSGAARPADLIGNLGRDLDDDLRGFCDPLVSVATIGEDLGYEWINIRQARGGRRRRDNPECSRGAVRAATRDRPY
jgi:hypothetical protein